MSNHEQKEFNHELSECYCGSCKSYLCRCWSYDLMDNPIIEDSRETTTLTIEGKEYSYTLEEWQAAQNFFNPNRQITSDNKA